METFSSLIAGPFLVDPSALAFERHASTPYLTPCSVWTMTVMWSPAVCEKPMILTTVR